MKTYMKAIIALGGTIAGVVVINKINDEYAKKHDGETWTHHVAEEVENHPITSSIIGGVAAITVIAIAKDYRDVNLPESYYVTKQIEAQARAKQHELNLKYQHEKEIEEHDREERRLEMMRNAEEKKRQDQLNYDRQMPPEYWIYKASEQDRLAREAEADYDSETKRYISDNDLEASKAKWESKIEAARIKDKEKEDEE